jgi:hypothetical protein
LNSGPTSWVTPPALFCEGFFQDSVSRIIYLSWLQTVILLISASWVTRITGVSHQCPVYNVFFIRKLGSCLIGMFLISLGVLLNRNKRNIYSRKWNSLAKPETYLSYLIHQLKLSQMILLLNGNTHVYANG